MSQTILCPVCETDNKPDATHCEVCGERLAPPAPGESLSPEESVFATIQKSQPVGLPETTEPSRGGFAFDDDEDFTDANTMQQGSVGAPVAFEPPAQTPAMSAPQPPPADQAEAKPEVLYSSLDGTPYRAGSPEHEEGFGPMGEELVSRFVAQPPVTTEPEEPEEPAESSEPSAPSAPAQATPQAASAPSPAQPTIATVRTPGREDIAVTAPMSAITPTATLTLFVNRHPVHTHPITSDETLIGRYDARSDVHPELDLTPWDPDANVSRKHAYIYRQNRSYTLYAVSNQGVQLNNTLLELGDRKPLHHGDIIIISGFLAFKFALPDQP